MYPTKTPLLFVCISLLCNTIWAQNSLLPDANFEQALIDQGIDSGTVNGSIPTSSISSVAYLDVSGKNITDMTGIEDFANLLDLDCSNNLLSNLNVRQNTQLVSLECNTNQINLLDLRYNTNLWYLNCSSNQLDSLDFNFNKLAFISCRNNGLKNIDFRNDSLLQEVDCSNNMLTNIDLRHTRLLWFICNHNQITSLNLDSMDCEFIFACSNNQLDSLRFNQTNLGSLDCSHNFLTEVDASSLNATYSGISSVHNLSFNDNQLSCLNLNNGRLNSVINSLNNPNLNCIDIHQPSWHNDSCTNCTIDTFTNFSDNCNNFCSLTSNSQKIEHPFWTAHIYPNPNQGSFFVALDQPETNLYLSIYASSGQLIWEKTTTQTQSEFINLSGFKGVYWLKVEKDSGVFIIQKIILL